ncbi:hypothetical protein PINS_up020809 [Pythium insidiosum]|nr:hypothetical protein PINS_up020809 [Pythium insidiosum]
MLNYIELVRITFQGGELPLGFASDFLPPAVDTIAISACNLRAMPDLVAQHWRTLSTLYLEMCELTSLPEPVLALDLSSISIAANHVDVIPFELFGADKRLGKLVIAGNPIQELPALVNGTEVPAGFWYIDASHTNISVIPTWVKHGLTEAWSWYASFAATPACASVERVLATILPDDVPLDEAWILSVDCFVTPLEYLLQLELGYVDQVSRLS